MVKAACRKAKKKHLQHYAGQNNYLGGGEVLRNSSRVPAVKEKGVHWSPDEIARFSDSDEKTSTLKVQAVSWVSEFHILTDQSMTVQIRSPLQQILMGRWAMANPKLPGPLRSNLWKQLLLYAMGTTAAVGGSLGEWDVSPFSWVRLLFLQWASSTLCWLFCLCKLGNLHFTWCPTQWIGCSGGSHHRSHPFLSPVSPSAYPLPCPEQAHPWQQ